LSLHVVFAQIGKFRFNERVSPALFPTFKELSWPVFFTIAGFPVADFSNPLPARHWQQQHCLPPSGQKMGKS
jgi:hypothetical protein